MTGGPDAREGHTAGAIVTPHAWWRSARKTTSASRLGVVVLALVVVSQGVAMAQSPGAPSASPSVSPSSFPITTIADGFAWPFEYALPPGSGLAPTASSRQMVALTEGSTEAYPGFG
jgi:hypothetical protein